MTALARVTDLRDQPDTKLDQFSARDIEVISSALRLYHGDLRGIGNWRGCEHIATLIWRLNKPGRTWVAEVEQ
jgi:hypothetical protein